MSLLYIDCTPLGRSLLTDDMIARVPGLQIHVGQPSASELPAMLAKAVAVINGRTTMDEHLLVKAPALQTIVFLGTGASSYIDLSAAQRLGIRVLTVRQYGDRTIAEHAFALMLSAARDVAASDRAIRAGRWPAPLGVELGSKCLGVIGTGGTGRELIRIAAAFGMKVLAWNRSPIDSTLPCEACGLDELLSLSDVVSLHLALEPQTVGFLNAERIARMRQGAMLINVARGPLIDTEALVEALGTGHLAHAGLDVFPEEPLPPGHALTTLENVTLTPHSAFRSRESMARLLGQGLELLAEDLKRRGAGDA